MNFTQQDKELFAQNVVSAFDLQTAEGGWSWFKGMRPSPEITGYILRGMSQLIELNAVEYNQEEKEMQIRALQFLDKEIADGFQKEQEHTLSSGRIDYLFVRSAYRDIPEPPATIITPVFISNYLYTLLSPPTNHTSVRHIRTHNPRPPRRCFPHHPRAIMRKNPLSISNSTAIMRIK